MPNAPLARRILAQIEADPKSWNQALWAERTDCGTTYCFAGWAIALTHPDATFRFVDHGAWVAQDVFIPGLGHQEIEDAARNLLGLGEYAARQLFNARNELDDLRSMVAELESPDYNDVFRTAPLLDPEDDQFDDDRYDDEDDD